MPSHTPNLHVQFDEVPPPGALDAFEQWAGPKGFCLERRAGGVSGFNRYSVDVTQAAWIAWLHQARTAGPAVPIAPLDVIDWRCALLDLVAQAEAAGYILTVDRVPGPGPLAMRNHVARVDSYEKR